MPSRGALCRGARKVHQQLSDGSYWSAVKKEERNKSTAVWAPTIDVQRRLL